MRFRVSPTRVQWVMIALMGVAYLAMLAWVYPELVGVISPDFEDTYSEWVWDAPSAVFWFVTIFHVLAGVLMIGSAWHFIEGRVRRRRLERDDPRSPGGRE